jgi:hypothetical protein
MNTGIPSVARSVASRRPYLRAPLPESGHSSEWANSHNGRWPVQIPEEHRPNAYAMFFPLIMMDWSLVFGERPIPASQQRLYEEHIQIFKNFLQSLKAFETCVDYYQSAQFLFTNILKNRGLELEHTVVWEILLLSPKPMTQREIDDAFAERMPQVTVGSRWDQLLRLIGAEEIYFCINRPGGIHVKLEGLDILDTVCRGDEAAFAQLKRKIESSHSWAKEICLGLKGVLPMMKMAAAIDGNSEIKAEIGLQIQERVKEVFGTIDVAAFGRSLEAISDRINGGGDSAARSRSNNNQDQQRQENSPMESRNSEQAPSPNSLFNFSVDLAMDEFLRKYWPRRGSETVEVRAEDIEEFTEQMNRTGK